MSIISNKLRLVYYDVPKVACTTLKIFFWEYETGQRFRPPTRSEKLLRQIGFGKRSFPPSVHYVDGYRTQSFQRAGPGPEGYQTMIVVRNYSAWRNKVNQASFERRDEMEDLRNEGLSVQPSFGEFLDNFDDYFLHSRPVRAHTRPYAWHLGSLAGIDHVFRIEEMSELHAFLNARTGLELPTAHHNKSASVVRDDSLTVAQAGALRRLTADEYTWLGDLYPEGPEPFLAKMTAQAVTH